MIDYYSLTRCAITISWFWRKVLCAFSASHVLCGELNRLTKTTRLLSRIFSPQSRRVKEFTQRI